MTNEREAAYATRSWMKEPVMLDDSGLRHVLAQLPEQPQRKHRWLWPFDWRPFGTGVTRSARPREATPTWRFTSMFTPIRVAAFTAVLALTGTLALMVGPRDPSLIGAPGAEASPDPMAPAHFTGTVRAHETGASGTTVVEEGRTVEEGWRSAYTATSTDLRMAGSGESVNYLETITTDGLVYLSHSSAGYLENDGGRFSQECTGAGGPEADAYITCWYSGEDGYEGLTAYTVLQGGASSGVWDVVGWIFPGNPPPTLIFEP